MRSIFILAFILIGVIIIGIFGLVSFLHETEIAGDWMYGNARLSLHVDGTGELVYAVGEQKYVVEATWKKTEVVDVYSIVIKSSKIPSDNYKYQDGYLIGSSATLVRG